MNKSFDVQKCVTVVGADLNPDDYVECAIMLIQCETKVIIVGEYNIDKVSEILDDIKDIRGGYDSLTICDTDCYIPKSMLKNEHVYLSTKDFLNAFPRIKDLYLDSISDTVSV